MYYRQNYNYYNQMPVNIPSQRTYVNPLNGRKTLSMKQMISSVERGVDTISSFLPLYQKVKPMLEQGKNIFKSIGGFFTNKNNKSSPSPVEKVEVEIINPAKEDDNVKNNSYFDYRHNQTDNRPFF